MYGFGAGTFCPEPEPELGWFPGPGAGVEALTNLYGSASPENMILIFDLFNVYDMACKGGFRGDGAIPPQRSDSMFIPSQKND